MKPPCGESQNAWNGIRERVPILRTSMKWTQSSNPAKKNIARGVPTRRKGLLDEVLNEAAQVELPTNYSEQPQSRWASLSITSTVAAAFTVLAAVYSLLIYSNNLTQEISKNQPPSSQKEIDDIPYVDRMTLSKQLLEPSVSFRRNGDGLVLMRSHRARHQKIRTTPYKP